MPPSSARSRRGDQARQAAVYRRRRLFAGLIAFAILILLFLFIRSLGGSETKPISDSTMPSPAARNWALSARVRRAAREQNEIIDGALAVTPVLRYGEGGKPQIALTFDDGPGPYTREVLDILEKHEAPATFFVIGGASDAQARLIQEEVARGHVVGNHTVHHAEMATLSRRDQASEVDGQTEAIELFGAPKPRLFRPPYNSWNDTTLEITDRRKMLTVLWSIDTNDWQLPGADVIVDRVLSAAHPGGIVLMHDGGGDRTQTVQALPRIIKGLRDQGYELVTIPQLLKDSPPTANQRDYTPIP
jgi:peptidoglycan/xylan/chitin deacetylase (PgdA/CDA1 family)